MVIFCSKPIVSYPRHLHCLKKRTIRQIGTYTQEQSGVNRILSHYSWQIVGGKWMNWMPLNCSFVITWIQVVSLMEYQFKKRKGSQDLWCVCVSWVKSVWYLQSSIEMITYYLPWNSISWDNSNKDSEWIVHFMYCGLREEVGIIWYM